MRLKIHQKLQHQGKYLAKKTNVWYFRGASGQTEHTDCVVLFQEPEVDMLRMQKDEELERYRFYVPEAYLTHFSYPC
jgi:hypothetical protein